MSTADASPTGIVRWEVLKGLPGEGPNPKHFHMGHPTPWAEGFVVKFINPDETTWVGNFQSSRFGHTEVIAWPEADSIVVIAADDFYLVDINHSDSYETLGPQHLVSGVMFDEERRTLFVAELYGICAFGIERKRKWIAEGLGGLILGLISCVGGVLTVEVEEETGEPSRIARLSAKDGTTL